MSLVHRLPGRRRATGWCEADASALAIADVASVHVNPSAIRAVVAETRHRYGGCEGVEAELRRRLTDSPHHTARTLAWAHGVLLPWRNPLQVEPKGVAGRERFHRSTRQCPHLRGATDP